MILQAMRFTPLGFATSAFEIVTLFRFDDTTIALGEGLKAWITETLAEALVGLASAGDTVDFTEEGQGDGIADKGIQRNPVSANGQMVLHCVFKRGSEFLNIAGFFHERIFAYLAKR